MIFISVYPSVVILARILGHLAPPHKYLKRPRAVRFETTLVPIICNLDICRLNWFLRIAIYQYAYDDPHTAAGRK